MSTRQDIIRICFENLLEMQIFRLHPRPTESEGEVSNLCLKHPTVGASLVAQWLRICLPMQGTRVRAPVWEDPTCREAARPVSHNY